MAEFTEEQVRDIVKRRDKRSEYTFGIQKFKRAEKAFENMNDDWGERNTDGFAHLVVGEEAFIKQIYFRVVERYYEYKTDKKNRETFEVSMGWDKRVSDYLLTFNFFFYSKRNKCYYTSMMEFGDDFMSVLSDRQWEIFFEIFDRYRLKYFTKAVVEMLDQEVANNYGKEPIDEGFYDMAYNDWLVDHFDDLKKISL